MRCPKCDLQMSPKEFDGVEVDRCFGCGGVYVDKGEMEQIAASFDAAGLPDGFAVGAAEIYRRLADLRDGDVSLDDVLDRL